MVAVLLTFVVTTTPATGVLAAITETAVPVGSAVLDIETDPTPTPTVEPSPVPEVTPDPVPATQPDPSVEPTPTPAPDPSVGPTPDPTAGPTPTPAPDPTAGPTPDPTAVPPVVPATVVVTPPIQQSRPRVVSAAKRPARLWHQLRRGLTVKGRASWYYATRGYAGAATVAMPGARFLPRGRKAPRARVCAGGRCTIVRVVDWCGCYARTPRARVADLSLATLRRLHLDSSRGVYRVKVTLIRPRH